MNKIEARSLLVLITFFASIQYVFIGAVGDDYSPFGFLSITNLTGFVMMFIIFAGTVVSEFYRIRKEDILHGSDRKRMCSLFLFCVYTDHNVRDQTREAET